MRQSLLVLVLAFLLMLGTSVSVCADEYQPIAGGGEPGTVDDPGEGGGEDDGDSGDDHPWGGEDRSIVIPSKDRSSATLDATGIFPLDLLLKYFYTRVVFVDTDQSKVGSLQSHDAGLPERKLVNASYREYNTAGRAR